MHLDRIKLSQCLEILKGTCGNKLRPVANCVLFDFSEGGMSLSTTNFISHTTIGYDDSELKFQDMPPKFLIDCQQLAAIVKASTTDSVELINSDTVVTVLANGEYKLRKYPEVDEFPIIDLACDHFVRWPVGYLKTIWSQVSVALSKDVTKINCQGVHYDGNFVATDNRRLAIVKGDQPYGGKPMSMLPAVGDLLKHCENVVEIGITNDGNMLALKCGQRNLNAGVRLIDAQFVPYQNLIDSAVGKFSVLIDKSMLYGALNRLSILLDKLYKQVNLKVIKDVGGFSLSMSVENRDCGEETVRLSDITGTEDAIQFSGAYHIDNFIDGIAVIDGDDVKLTFMQDGKIFIIDDEFTYVLSNIVA